MTGVSFFMTGLLAIVNSHNARSAYIQEHLTEIQWSML